jgi:protein-S-isoprenylcysteine O-methyltransferase Ste14
MYDMTVYRWIIGVCWLVFLGVWVVTAFGAKPSVNARRDRWQVNGLRLAILIAVLLALRLPDVHHALRRPELVVHDPRAGLIGSALVLLGIGLAVWARFVIGRNWGHPMTQRENPELVTTGPYSVIRHPIYTGVLTAVMGAALAIHHVLLLAFLLLAAFFIYSARQEEKRMALLFPVEYPAYKARTKMLFPFIL